MTATIIRIVLRYAAAFLVAKGLIDPSLGGISTDPDVIASVEAVIGLIMAGIAEGWFILAKRFGWKT